MLSSVHLVLLRSPKTLWVTKGYITSLSRSPRDQYTWLSSLTAIPQTPGPKGGSAQNLRRLMFEKTTNLLIWLTTLPLLHSPSQLHYTTGKLSMGFQFLPYAYTFIHLWRFPWVKKFGVELILASLCQSASCFHCGSDLCLYWGE